MEFHFETVKVGLEMLKKNQQHLVNFFQKDDPPNSNQNRLSQKHTLEHISELRNRLNFLTKLLKIKRKEGY